MDAFLAILGGAIVAAIAYYIGFNNGHEAARAQAAIIIAGWKDRAEKWRRADQWNRTIVPLRAAARTSSHKPQWQPYEVYATLQRTALGKHVPIETIEDWSLEHREQAYLWALQVIGGRDSPAPLCVIVNVPIPGERKS